MSSEAGLRPQYKVLSRLKRLDEKIHRLRRDAGRIPEEIEKLEQTLSSRKSEFDTYKSQFDADEKRLRSTELDLKEREEAIVKAEGKMMEVKTNAAYQAGLKEIQAQKKEKGRLEEEALSLLDDVDGKREDVTKTEGEFTEFEATVKKEVEDLTARRQELVNQVEGMMGGHEDLVKELEPRTQSIYRRHYPKMEGSPVSIIEGGICKSCNLRLRPQMFNEMLGFRAIHQCGGCGRIVITSEVFQETADGPAEN